MSTPVTWQFDDDSAVVVHINHSDPVRVDRLIPRGGHGSFSTTRELRVAIALLEESLAACEERLREMTTRTEAAR